MWYTYDIYIYIHSNRFGMSISGQMVKTQDHSQQNGDICQSISTALVGELPVKYSPTANHLAF